MEEARSGKPPEELLAGLVFQLNTALGGKGYRLMSRGPAGLSYQRQPEKVFYGGLGLAVFGLIVLLGGAVEGLVFLVPGLAMVAARFPARVSMTFSRSGSETQIKAQHTIGPITLGRVGPVIERAVERAL